MTSPVRTGNQRALPGDRPAVVHEGWTGNLAMADDIFSGDLRTDGVEVRDSAIWHFRDGKITEIFTLQDQFGFLKQIGYFPESVSPA